MCMCVNMYIFTEYIYTKYIHESSCVYCKLMFVYVCVSFYEYKYGLQSGVFSS